MDLNNLIEGNFTVKDHKESTPNAGYDSGDFEGWEFLPGSVGFDLEEWELLPNKITEVTGHGKTDGLLLKLHDMKGQVNFCLISILVFVINGLLCLGPLILLGSWTLV